MPRPKRIVSHAVAALPALGATALLAWKMGGIHGWPALSLPLGLFVFVYLWTLWLNARVRPFPALTIGVITGAILAHVAIWLPLLLGAFALGQGPSRFDYALFSAVFTAGLVGWYILTAHIWQTALIAGATLALLTDMMLQRKRQRITR